MILGKLWKIFTEKVWELSVCHSGLPICKLDVLPGVDKNDPWKVMEKVWEPWQ